MFDYAFYSILQNISGQQHLTKFFGKNGDYGPLKKFSCKKNNHAMMML